MSSPTQRTLLKLRKEGWTVCTVERYIAAIRQRKDAFGFGDLLCFRVGQPGATLVQTTSGSNFAARLTKIRTIAEAGMWLEAGNRILLHGWAKQGERGKRKTYVCRELEITKEILGGRDNVD